MATGAQSSGQFLASSIASIAAATKTTNFTSLVVPVWDVLELMLQGEVTGGNASADGEVDFVLAGRIKDGGTWDTVAAFTLTLDLNGTTAVLESGQIDVQGFHSLKLLSVENKDASYTATLVNLNWGKSYGFRCW